MDNVNIQSLEAMISLFCLTLVDTFVNNPSLQTTIKRQMYSPFSEEGQLN